MLLNMLFVFQSISLNYILQEYKFLLRLHHHRKFLFPQDEIQMGRSAAHQKFKA